MCCHEASSDRCVLPAQLHGNANRIMANKLDAILTGDLNSGRDCARAKRKALLKTVRARPLLVAPRTSSAGRAARRRRRSS